MATIRHETIIAAPAEAIWDAVRDVGAIHTRLAPGFVTDTRLDGDGRIVTFANGTVVREAIITVDEAARRLAYSAQSERLEHHSASIEIAEAPEGARFTWIADLLPDAVAPYVDSQMRLGTQAVKAMFEG